MQADESFLSPLALLIRRGNLGAYLNLAPGHSSHSLSIKCFNDLLLKWVEQMDIGQGSPHSGGDGKSALFKKHAAS